MVGMLSLVVTLRPLLAARAQTPPFVHPACETAWTGTGQPVAAGAVARTGV